jgi:hypothetical protein
MSCEFICDGCGKREPAGHNQHGDWFKPRSWFQRSDKDGIQVACCRSCIDKIAEKTGKTSVVLPI